VGGESIHRARAPSKAQGDKPKTAVGEYMSTMTKALALAAFVGVLGMSGFASAKTQEATHEHAAQVNRSREQRKDAGHGYCGWTLLINPATEVAAAIY
jgi:hypothetical protein